MKTNIEEREEHFGDLFSESELRLLKKVCAGSIAKVQRLEDLSENESLQYLPLWMHLSDTACVMDYLFRSWLSNNLRDLLVKRTGSFDKAAALLRFLAMIHDIGKVNADFASRVLSKLPDYHGFELEGELRRISRQYLHHSRVGEIILSKYGLDHSLKAGGIASIVGAHHGDFQESVKQDVRRMTTDLEMRLALFGKNGSEAASWDRWINLWNEIIEVLQDLSGFSLRDEFCFTREEQIWLSGLVIAADWIASDTEIFPLIDSTQDTVVFYRKRAAESLEKVRFSERWKASPISADQFQDIFGFKPNTMQEKVLQVAEKLENGGLMIIESGTGSGKTEAALAAAQTLAAKQKLGGIFFGLPTCATADGLLKRVLSWAGQQSESDSLSFRLAHSKAASNKLYASLMRASETPNPINVNQESPFLDSLVVYDWMLGSRRQLLSDIVVGTVDQLLMSSVKARFVSLKQLGMAGKVVILDEIHSFDEYTNCFIDKTLEYCGSLSVPVVLCSATLTVRRRVEMAKAYLRGRSRIPGKTDYDISEKSRSYSYPMITWTEGDSVLSDSDFSATDNPRNISLEFIDESNSLEKLASQMGVILAENLQNGGKAGIIVNTVGHAQKLYKKLRELLPDMKVKLIHSRYTEMDRRQLEDEIISELGPEKARNRWNEADEEKIVVIGTSVLQESLDISFDLMISELCPIDLLFQRLGRLHRWSFETHPKLLEDPVCFLFSTSMKPFSDQKIYDKFLLNKTYSVLLNVQTIRIPESIPELIKCVYERDPEGTEKEEKDYVEWVERMNGERKDPENLFLLPSPQKRVARKRRPAAEETLDDLFQSGTYFRADNENIVRKGIASVPVILLKAREGRFYFIDETEILADRPLSQAEKEKLGKQRVNLPYSISVMNEIFKNPDALAAALDKHSTEDAKRLLYQAGIYDCSPLIVTDQNQCEVLGVSLCYDSDFGLSAEYRERF